MVSFAEKLRPLTEAVERVTGTRMNYSTIWRWTQNGILTPTGDRIRLDFTKCGSKRLTSDDAVRRFFAAQTAAACPAAAVNTAEQLPTRRSRATSVAAAERELESIGL